MVVLAVAAVVLLLLERVSALRFRPASMLRPHVASDAVYLLTGYVAGGALAAAWVADATGWLGARTGFVPGVWPAVPYWAQVLVALVALDLGNYVAHWLLHRVDALWEVHKVHHSILHLDWLTTFRSHVLEQVLRRVVAPALLVLGGLPTAAVAAAAALHLAFAMLNHANVRLPLAWLEGVLITPRLHRLHHVPATSERNLGTVFACWDQLRGTLVRAELPADATLGFPRQPADYPQSWGPQLLAPFVSARGISAPRSRRA